MRRIREEKKLKVKNRPHLYINYMSTVRWQKTILLV